MESIEILKDFLASDCIFRRAQYADRCAFETASLFWNILHCEVRAGMP